MNDIVFSSESDYWETPRSVFDPLHEILNFDWDIAASDLSHMIDDYCTPKRSAFRRLFENQTLWCNPPYSRFQDWLDLCISEGLSGNRIVMLVPARTDIIAWHDHVYDNMNVFLFRGRLKFVNRHSQLYHYFVNQNGYFEDETDFVYKMRYFAQRQGINIPGHVTDKKIASLHKETDTNKIANALSTSAPFPSALLTMNIKHSERRAIQNVLDGVWLEKETFNNDN